MAAEKIKCPVCGRMIDKRGMNGHLRTHKKDDPETPASNGSPQGATFDFDEKKKKEPSKEDDTITCGSCGTEIKHGQESCTGCGGVFEW